MQHHLPGKKTYQHLFKKLNHPLKLNYK